LENDQRQNYRIISYVILPSEAPEGKAPRITENERNFDGLIS
jgi:hypothetical protein